jgi:hypothetical protein
MYLVELKGFLPAREVQWVDSEKWLLILDSRALKQKFEVMRLGQVVQNRF